MQSSMDQKTQDQLKERHEKLFSSLADQSLAERQKILSALILDLKAMVSALPDTGFLHEALGRAIREKPFSTDGQLELMEVSFQKSRMLKVA